MKVKHLRVATPDAIAGDLHRESQFVFNYASKSKREEVSLTMPIRAESYTGNALMPVFSMNLPEGYLFDAIARRLAKFGKIDEMRLLEITGRQQIGRLQFVLPGENWQQPKPQVGLAELRSSPASSGMFEFLVETYFGSGVSGVQPKVLVPDADRPLDDRATIIHSDLIVKSGGEDYPFLSQNEFLCMDAARRAGLQVPEFWLSDDGGLLILRRFDLEPKRRGFEEMSVLMGKLRDRDGNYKYTESYEAITRFIATFSDAETSVNLKRFFEYLCLSIMVRNGDAHLKNFGLTYDTPETGPKLLAPIYDVVTTSVYPYLNWRTGEERYDKTMALKLFSGAKDRHYPSRERLLEFGSGVCKVRKPEIVLERIGDAMSEAWQANRDLFDADMSEKLAKEWDAGRASLFPAGAYVGARSISAGNDNS